jgi:uncharacterized HAD superfamily protein
MDMFLGQGITPEHLAFDIDGVVADTMALFVRIAHERYGLVDLKKEDMRCYDLSKCLRMDRQVLDELICLTLDDEHTLQTPPMSGASEILTDLARHGPLRFVTARIWPESITQWLHNTLPDVPSDHIHVVATGKPEAKLQILKDLGVRCFIEDRVETCRMLAEDGIQPLIFDQPWNRGVDLFPRLESWPHFRQWLKTNNP